MVKQNESPLARLNRRRFIGSGLFGLGAAAVSSVIPRSAFAAPTASFAPVLSGLDFESGMYPFELPPLPYAFDALEPYIDARTMEIHYTKHHAGYVRKLNAALENYPDLHDRTLGELVADYESLPESVRTAVRNNGGGHLNHCLFWYSMKNGGSRPSEELQARILELSGTPEALLDEMVQAGLGRFGSGWAWLCANPSGSLVIVSTPNQDSPWSRSPTLRPLLGVDVWEHAYYLKYQNRRGDYLNAWTNLVDWQAVGKRLVG